MSQTQTTKFAPWVPERLVFSHFLRVRGFIIPIRCSTPLGNLWIGSYIFRLCTEPSIKGLTYQFWRNAWVQNHEFVNSLKLSKIIWNIQMFFQISNTADTAEQIYILQRLIKKPTLFSFLRTVFLFRQENIWFTLKMTRQ